MRRTMFGDPVIEETTDDLFLLEELQEAGDKIYAVVREEEPGKFAFEIQHNESGESIVTSDSIFLTVQTAREYLHHHGITDIEVG